MPIAARSCFPVFAFGLPILFLAACETAASDPPPQSRSLAAVQVTGAFPVHIASDGAVTRVCGAPLDGSAPLAVNGVQFAVNLVADAPVRSKCAQDGDWSVHEGERIDGQVVTASGKRPSVDAAKWSLDLTCVGPRSATAETCQGLSRQVAAASEVRYVGTAPRCNPGLPSTAHNVAVVMDHSGSISGNVNTNDKQASEFGKEFAGEKVVLEPDFKALWSDPFDTRIEAARDLIDSLSSSDRVVSYYFDEYGPAVACSSARTCEGSEGTDSPCATDGDCGERPAGGPYLCEDRLDLNQTDANKYFSMSPQEQAASCFGSTTEARADNKTGLEFQAKLGGVGRAPIWAAMKQAYDFLTVGGGKDLPGPKHLVLFADGPDTCTLDEDFNWLDFSSSAKHCLSECTDFAVHYQPLLDQMAKDGFPVQLHFIQFQSPGYREPEMRWQDLACRSGGTYQFLTTQGPLKYDGTAFIQVMTEATRRIRQAMSGQWHVSFALPELQSADNSSPVPLGTLGALQGEVLLTNSALPSVATAFEVGNGTQPHRFGLTGPLDQRLVMRKACRDAADCGGTDQCAAFRCTSQGLCSQTAAKDQLPCGGANVCCNASCKDSCKSGCEKP